MDAQATGGAFSSQKSTSSNSRDEISSLFSFFVGHFCPPGSGSAYGMRIRIRIQQLILVWIRIRIRNPHYSISTKLVTDHIGILFLGPPRQRSDPEEVGGRER
jgi:hypothetical protein